MMAISKRTRFEVLRRDSHTCRYCGASAPDVKLHVDHVTPTALGGTDDPSNLVAACVDCNNGKGSTGPGEQLVADVDADVIRWARARSQAIAEFRADRGRVNDVCERIVNFWHGWDAQLRYLPTDFTSTVEGWLRSGLSPEDIEDCYFIASGAKGVSAANVWRYMCGVARNRVADIDSRTDEILAGGDS